MMTDKHFICPNCNQPILYLQIDCFGHTPFHLHCKECNINIGANSVEKCFRLIEKYHVKNTYIEYYNKTLYDFTPYTIELDK